MTSCLHAFVIGPMNIHNGTDQLVEEKGFHVTGNQTARTTGLESCHESAIASLILQAMMRSLRTQRPSVAFYGPK
jgi:hypothetical protein